MSNPSKEAITYFGTDGWLERSVIQPATKATIMNDSKKPPVGVISCIGPASIPAKTGTPAVPTNTYVTIAKLPNFFPSINPAKIEKNVCSDNGTEVPPIGIARNGNHTAILAPMAIKQTNNAPTVISIGLIFLIVNTSPITRIMR